MPEHEEQRTVIGNVVGDVVSGNKVTHHHHGDARYDVRGLANPFIGLSSFTYSDRAIFAGRERAVAEAVGRLTDPESPATIMFITGASGAGKSSFVQAGLLPALEQHYARRGITVRHAIFRPSRHPVLGMHDALAQLGLPFLGFAPQTPAVYASLMTTETPENQINVLVVDQFEEIYTQSDPGERSHLLALLEQIPPFERLRLHLLVTVRADFLDEVFARPRLFEIAKQGIELRAMTSDELASAVLRPIQVAFPDGSKGIEPELVDALARDGSADATYLPLVQVTLEDLWKRGVLKRGAYTSFSDAIRRRADEVLRFRDADGMRQQERPPEEQQQIIDLLLTLVDTSPSDERHRAVRRRRRHIDLTQGDPARERLLDELASARLISKSVETLEDHQEEMVDLIHEALLHDDHGWATLQVAIDERRQQLRLRQRFEELLQEWRAASVEQRDRLLLSGIRLEEALTLQEANDVAVRGHEARTLIDASVAARDRERQLELDRALALAQAEQRRVRVLRWGSAVLLVVAAIAVAATVIALRLAEKANQNAANYQAQLQAGDSQVLAVNAEQSMDNNPELGLRLALEAMLRAETPLAHQSLNRALMETGALRTTFSGHKGSVNSVVVSPDGAHVLTASADSTARLWDLDGGAIATMQHPSPVESATFSPDGELVLTTAADGSARLWDQCGRSIATLDTGYSSGGQAFFSADGSQVVTQADDTVKLWATDGTLLQTLVMTGVQQLAVSPITSRLATIDAAGALRIWGLDGTVQSGFDTGDANTRDLIFSPDGQTLLMTTGDGEALKGWDLAGTQLLTITAELDPFLHAHYSANGESIIILDQNGLTHEWTADGQELGVFSTHDPSENDRNPVSQMLISPDGEYVLTIANRLTLWESDGSNIITLNLTNPDSGEEAENPPPGDGGSNPDSNEQNPPGGPPSNRPGRDAEQDAEEAPAQAEKLGRAAFTADGGGIVVFSADGGGRLYPITPENMIALGRCALDRTFDDGEVASFQIDEPIKLDLSNRQCPAMMSWEK